MKKLLPALAAAKEVSVDAALASVLRSIAQ